MFGLFLCGFGLAFTIEANLGLNSWDVFHDGFSKVINVKIGFAGVITGFILLLGWIPLKQVPFIGTIINILTIGNVIDLTMTYLPSPEASYLKHFSLYFGTIVFATQRMSSIRSFIGVDLAGTETVHSLYLVQINKTRDKV